MSMVNKVAVVTGAGTRIGAAIAGALAQPKRGKPGALVVVHYNTSGDKANDVVASILSIGGSAVAYGANLSDEDAAKHITEFALREFGRPVQILVNSAAPFPKNTILDFTASDFDYAMQAIARGPALLTQAVAQALPGGWHAAVTNIIDVMVGSKPYADRTTYAMAKAALRELTFDAAKNLAPHIRVNAISPGAILQAAGEDAAHHQAVISGVPLGREGGVKAIVSAVLFLIENDFITGIDLPVDGGAHLL